MSEIYTGEPTVVDIERARKVIARSSLITRTPTIPCLPLSIPFGSDIWQKLELLQPTGSFKVRGAINALSALMPEVLTRGVVTASTGNHALALAYVCYRLNIPATLVVPRNVSVAKLAALSNYSATVVLAGDDYDSAELHARQLESTSKAFFVSSYNDSSVITGQGTIASEILEDLPETGTILVPVGGGGLISGIAVAAKTRSPHIRVIGIQSEASPAVYASVKSGKIVLAPDNPTLADGLSGGLEQGSVTFNLIMKYVDDIILVTEDEISKALTWYAQQQHLMVEGAGAVGIAALLSGKIQGRADQRPIVDVITGRNIDHKLFARYCIA